MSELLSEEENVLITDIAMFLAHESQEHGGYGWDSLSHETQTVYMMQGKRLYLEVLPKLRCPREGSREAIVRVVVAHLAGLTVAGVNKLKWGETNSYVKFLYWGRGESVADSILALLPDEQEIRKEERK